MAVSGWIVDKSAAARGSDPVVSEQLVALVGMLYVCPVGELEQLYSARSALDYDAERVRIHDDYRAIAPPSTSLNAHCGCSAIWLIATGCGIASRFPIC